MAHRHGDYNPLCSFCGKPVQAVVMPSAVGAENGGLLQLRMVPGRGLGVFSLRDIADTSLVERCPAFVLDGLTESMKGVKTYPYTEADYKITLGHLLFPWIKDGTRALVVGYAMLYNHEPPSLSNVRYEPYIDPETNRRFIDFYAKRDIVAGEELVQTYAANHKLWFTPKGRAAQ